MKKLLLELRKRQKKSTILTAFIQTNPEEELQRALAVEMCYRVKPTLRYKSFGDA